MTFNVLFSELVRREAPRELYDPSQDSFSVSVGYSQAPEHRFEVNAFEQILPVMNCLPNFGWIIFQVCVWGGGTPTWGSLCGVRFISGGIFFCVLLLLTH